MITYLVEEPADWAIRGYSKYQGSRSPSCAAQTKRLLAPKDLRIVARQLGHRLRQLGQKMAGLQNFGVYSSQLS
jgi:hypothetical protein